MRYAIYFTPPQGSALTRAAESWLGYSAFTGAASAIPAEREAVTVSARRYGFHATLKAPFRMADGVSEAELLDAFENWTVTQTAFTGPRLVIEQIDGFFALVPKARNEALDAFARDVVIEFEPFRAPLTADDMSRRNPDRLTSAERDMLEAYGYPYVLDEFRFHMTLTDRIPEADAPQMRARLEEHFRASIEEPIAISSLALFVEPEPGAPFRVRAFHDLASQSMRKTA
ncbi:DUF1045 domain-containing protein [Aliihoeflea aestuarii]|jgi:putative phosphonate metabolism protein|uniref:DUF1045 domain-containing protein n=1 Tax=Aliihoeflea aestuarii TaxID=453840 RepID=UPI002092FD4B|nr:DUF1045 domain-containing protein [Aliihoeflea aestuarii]MCO6390610.1 DUF1045 domain-containing protein [Aliihoeflea aestuarii]